MVRRRVVNCAFDDVCTCVKIYSIYMNSILKVAAAKKILLWFAVHGLHYYCTVSHPTPEQPFCCLQQQRVAASLATVTVSHLADLRAF